MVENKESKPPGDTSGNKKKEEPKKKEPKEEEKEKTKSRKDFSKREKEENKTSEEKQDSAYQKLIREINKAYGRRYYPKNDAERIEAERQIKELEVKREEYIRRARAEGWLDEKTEMRLESAREGATRGKMFFNALLEESGRPTPDPEGIPEELRGVNQDYYQKEVFKIIGEKSTPTDQKQQEGRLREYLKILRTIRLTPDLIQNNPIWNEMVSMIPYFKPELQEEFKARFEIFRYALGFKDADGVEGGVAGSSRVHLSHIGKALEVSEIGKAYDLIEENSQITKEEIMIRKNLSEKDAEEELKNENPLCMGAKKRNKAVLENLSLKLAKTFGEKTDGLNKDEREELAEKYMWAVEEANDIWRITFRSDETDINMKGRGGQWWLNRLFHYAERLENKGFGYKSTRKYFNKPFFPEKIAPSKKGEGRGLMMKGFWEYQIGKSLKIEGLEDLKFEREGGKGYIYHGEDGNGRELPYVIYKREFDGPNGKKKNMEVRMSVDKKGNYTNVIEVVNPSAEILSKICQQVPEGFYGSYVGDWIVKADNTKKLLEGGVLKFPPGSQDDMRRLLEELQSKKLFDYLDPLSKDEGGRKPGKYYQEDAWEDLIRGAVDFGLHEGKHMFEPWKIWGAWRAGVLTKAATDFKVITDEQGREIENEMLHFLGMRGNIPRWLRCNFDRYTMVYRWGPMRMMMLGEMLKRFFEGIFQGPPFAPSK